MDDVRFVNAFFGIEFSKFDENGSVFMEEFEKLSKENTDPINEWIRHQKANGNADETDKILLNLIVELHKKVDILTQKLDGKESVNLNLSFKSSVVFIGYGYFKIKDQIFNVKQKYYGRISLPIFPKRPIPVIFIAEDTNTANIIKISPGDEKDWDSYVSRRERELIREMKGVL